MPLLQTTTLKRRERTKGNAPPQRRGGGDEVEWWAGYWDHWWLKMGTSGGTGTLSLCDWNASMKVPNSVIVPHGNSLTKIILKSKQSSCFRAGAIAQRVGRLPCMNPTQVQFTESHMVP